MSTLLIHAPAPKHTKLHHPENAVRIANILPSLEEFGVLSDLTLASPVRATFEQLRSVHTKGLIEYIRLVSSQGGGLLDQGDTYATAESYDLARLAAGSCCLAVDQIMAGAVDNAFALVRPPGHHAENDNISGFCLFNNVAVAARHAREAHGLDRVMVLDFDVHHGNGTQDIFYEDESVLFVSLHLYAPYFYPGIGGLHEIGTRAGRGTTLNVPFPPNVGDVGYRRAMQEVIIPRVRDFAPDMILISAGYDAHWRDPLAMAGLSLRGYGYIMQDLMCLADELCEGRILCVLEGGYEIDVLTYGIVNTFHALLGRDQILDPFGPSPQMERDVSSLLAQLKQRHLPN